MGVVPQSLNRLKRAVYLTLRHLLRTVRYFFEILRGDMSGLSIAPVTAKHALGIRQQSLNTPITTSRLPSTEEVWDACVDAHAATGAWPISFSHPRTARTSPADQSPTISPVFPGHKYSFDDEADYLDMYGRHSFALTHKKAGWDCFRHVEIFASGAIPFMPDASLIPPHTMVHYPKTFLSEVADHLLRSRGNLSPRVQQAVRDYFTRHLTTRAMAEYILRVSPPVAQGTVLFVDEAVGETPDYQSVLTLIGLKQILGSRVTLATPVPYLYSDWAGNAQELYGRGFGYSRVLVTDMKSESEVSGAFVDLGGPLPASVDLLVVGSITRNYERAVDLLGRFPPSQTVWVHGEDEGPTASELSRYRNFGVTVFVRELNVE